MTVCAHSAAAQTVAVGPYYATPSWDQSIPCTAATNCSRFVVLSNFDNAAVLDRETGLVWERSPSTAVYPWSSGSTSLTAGYHCLLEVTLGGRIGWRLPTVNELASLVDKTSSSSPTLPPGHPFQNVLFGSAFDDYWTATTTAGSANAARVLNFRDGQIGASPKSDSQLVWCVRGGQVVDPQ